MGEKEDGEWGIFCTLPCDVATGVCRTLLFLLRVKVVGPLSLSHQQNDHDR